MSDHTLTRAELTESLKDTIGLGRTESAQFLDDVLELMADALEKEGEVKLARFGKFETRLKSERIGRNPKTGDEARIEARRVISFRPSAIMKQRVAIDP